MFIVAAAILLVAGVVILLVPTAPRPWGVLAIVAAVGVALAGAVVIVPSGHVGVPVLFGKVQDRSLPDGLHLINPLLEIQKLSVRTEVYTMSGAFAEGVLQGDDSIVVLSRDGLEMPLDITVAYRLVAADAPWIYRNIGQEFAEKIIRPAARTAIREAASRYTAQEAYSTKRDELASMAQQLLATRVKDLFGRQGDDFEGVGVAVQQVMLRNVALPSRVRAAIEEKLSAEQDAQRMEFVLQKETQEAERKRIEAQGVSDFQQIVSQGISPELLRWKGIEATLDIATSPNAKVIIIGSGQDGLPVILGSEK